MLVLLACTLVHLYWICYGFTIGALGPLPVGTVWLSLLPILLLFAYLTFRSTQKANRLKAESQALADKLQQLTAAHQTQEKLINELEETNFKLVELDHFKQGFTQMIAHDMKNSLNAIIGLSRGQLSRQKQEHITQSGEHLLNMVFNMLDAQRFEEVKVPLNRQLCFLDDLLQQTLQRLRFQLDSKMIRVQNQLSDNLMVYVDKDLIIRVLGNLLANAIRYSPPESAVVIESEVLSCQKTLQISITDYGEGVLKEYQQHLFEKYWQLTAHKSGKQASIGLGLAFSKLAIEAHEGQIGVQSEYGKHTTIFFTLPTEQPKKADDSPEGSMHNPNPMLIDNEELPLLMKYGERLAKMQVHEFSKINRVVKELEKAGAQSEWIQQLIAAVHQGNQTRFEELVRLLQ